MRITGQFLDVNNKQAKNLVLDNRANATGLTGTRGLVYANSTDGGFYYHNGTSWVRLDNQFMNTDYKESVKVETDGPITLDGEQQIRGVSVVAGDRVLVKDQGDSTNGIYIASLTTWTKAPDATGANLTNGAQVFSETTGIGYVLTGGYSWSQFSRTSRKYMQDIGNGTDSTFTITHALGTEDVMVQVREATDDKAVVLADIEIFNVMQIKLKFDPATPPTNNQYRVLVIG